MVKIVKMAKPLRLTNPFPRRFTVLIIASCSKIKCQSGFSIIQNAKVSEPKVTANEVNNTKQAIGLSPVFRNSQPRIGLELHWNDFFVFNLVNRNVFAEVPNPAVKIEVLRGLH